MLSQIVRPMVRTQIQLLANCQATRATLVSTVSQWLGFLGVRAQVTRLDAGAGKIHICLTVDKPEACDVKDWQKILQSLEQGSRGNASMPQPQPQMTPHQEIKLQRLLAYLIQIGEPDKPVNWERLYPELQRLELDEPTLLGIKSALKVPQSLDRLIDGLDPDVAAIALPKAVSIAMLDRQVNSHEDYALTALLQAMKQAQEVR